MSSPLMNQWLEAASSYGASDLHLIVGLPPALRINGEIVMADYPPLTTDVMERVLLELLNEEQRNTYDKDWELCVSMPNTVVGRVRITIYKRNGSAEFSVRFCGRVIPTRQELGLPSKIDELARKPNGLVLITGPTGAGKSTTLNYMINLINQEQRSKIITIEDPIEYVHENKRAIIVQQEVMTDTRSFNRALIHALRQDPNIIVVGEMRDHQAISTALTAAETGHLVLGTLHSSNVVQTMERITGVFEGSAQRQIVIQLANALQGIMSQDLLISSDRSRRILAYELLVATPAIRNVIRENKIHQIESIMQLSGKEGMVTLDACLQDLYSKGQISYDTMMSRARYPDRVGK